MFKLNIVSMVLALGLFNVGCGKFSAVSTQESSSTGSLPGLLTYRGLAPAGAACRVRIPVCAKDSSIQGTHQVSADQATCLSYSKLVFDHCENSGSQLITSEYLVRGVVSASSKYPDQVVTQPATTPSSSQTSSTQNQAAAQPATSCQIEVPSCPNASVPRSFQDSEAAANQSPDRCVQRAEDYYRWCAGSNESPIPAVTARFYQNGGVTASRSFPSANGSQCMVKLVNGCPGNPQYSQRAFVDFNQESNNSASVCVAQAERYAGICAVQVKTEFYQNGAIAVSTAFPRVFNPPSVVVGNTTLVWSYPIDVVGNEILSYVSITAPTYIAATSFSILGIIDEMPARAPDKKYSCGLTNKIECFAGIRCGVTTTGRTVCKSSANDNFLLAEARLVNGSVNVCQPVATNPGYFYCY